MAVCPLIFEPIFKPKIWGGRNLERLLGKRLPPAEPIGESWECADLAQAQSVVARGPAKGKAIHHLVETWGADLLGRAQPTEGRFPLLIKFLDAVAPLSIQVHPSEDEARRLGQPELVKHEAWHILDAAPGAVVYRDLAPGVTLQQFEAAARHGDASMIDCLRKIPVRPGDTFYLPSGVIHALGAGIVLAEIQMPSDTTYRIYDYGRTRPGGDAGLHLDLALANIRAGLKYDAAEKRSHVTSVFTTVTRLVTSPRFTIERVRFTGGIEQEIPYAELVCWIVLNGTGEILFARDGRESFGKGDVVVLPAALQQPRLRTISDCTWLEVTIPIASDLGEFPRPSGDYLRAREGTAGHPLQIGIPDPKPPHA